MDSTVHYVVQRRGSVGTSDAERATQEPLQHLLRGGSAARPDRQPRPRLHRRRGQAHARALAVLRRGQPGHRRDPVRRRRRRRTGPTRSSSTPGAPRTRPGAERGDTGRGRGPSPGSTGLPCWARRSPTRCRPRCTAPPTPPSACATGPTRRRRCARHELAGFVAGLGPEWAGLSLTMPLKEAAFAVAGEVSPLARQVGAVNTLVRSGPRRVDGAQHRRGRDDASAAGGRGGRGARLVGARPRAGLGGDRPLGGRVAGRARGVRHHLRGALRRPARDRRAGPGGGPGRAGVPAGRGAGGPAGRVAGRVDAAGWRRAAAPSSATSADLSGRVLLDVVYAGWPTPLARAFARSRRCGSWRASRCCCTRRRGRSS